MDYDTIRQGWYAAVWDAQDAAGHAACGGWRFDPGDTLVTCACGEQIPLPDQEAVTP